MPGLETNELVDLLATHGVANVQNGLIHALALWLEQHIHGDAARQRKLEAFYLFRDAVWQVVNQEQFERKKWPEDRPLPYPKNELKVIHALAERALQKMKGMSFEQGLLFLAELWGGWILACPDRIIRESPEYGSYAASAPTESERNEYVFQYLDIVYGMMI